MGSEAGPTLGRRNVLPAERKRDGQLHALGRCIQEVEQCLTHVVRISDEDPVARKDAVEGGRFWSACLMPSGVKAIVLLGIRAQRPSVAEQHRLTRSPILVLDLGGISGRNRVMCLLLSVSYTYDSGP